MKIRQLSLFLENKPGRLAAPCRVLAEAGVDIRTLAVADTREFGILRMIVSDWETGQAALARAGYAVRVTEVLAVEVPDQPGGLVRLLDVLDRSPVNIEYMYAFPAAGRDNAVLIFRFDDTDAAIALLKEAGMNVLASVDIYRRTGSR